MTADWYEKLYRLCLSGMILFAVASVFLFIKLDIRTAFRVLRKKEWKTEINCAGKDQKKRTQKLSDEGWKTEMLEQEREFFSVEKEILLIHTDETIE